MMEVPRERMSRPRSELSFGAGASGAKEMDPSFFEAWSWGQPHIDYSRSTHKQPE